MSQSRLGWFSNQQKVSDVKICLKGAFKNVKPMKPYKVKKGQKELTSFSL